MDKTNLKLILQEEINHHNKEREKHLELWKQTKSKRQRRKALKHFHKKFQTIKIAQELGFEFCPMCGGLR